ncbi:MAG: type IV pilus biogenesis/stability protein PilW [Proteobacteria bacterium]|nr:type IV pilus biogenesis/stability protein PilW [Pseudomonadota bacterium]
MLKSLRLFVFLSLILLQACSKYSLQPANISDENPNKAAIYNTQLGLLYLKNGDKKRAKYKILSALKQAPKNAEANLAFAYLLEKNGDVGKARLYYNKALKYAPKNGVVLNNYGAFLCRKGDYKKAEFYFLQAVDDIDYIETAAAFENAGLCLAASGENKKAIFYFEKALREDSKRKQAFFELIHLELKEEHYKKAFATMEKYLKFIDDKKSLKLAIFIAKKAGQIDAQNRYEKQLKLAEHSGVEHESNSRNG